MIGKKNIKYRINLSKNKQVFRSNKALNFRRTYKYDIGKIKYIKRVDRVQHKKKVLLHIFCILIHSRLTYDIIRKQKVQQEDPAPRVHFLHQSPHTLVPHMSTCSTQSSNSLLPIPSVTANNITLSSQSVCSWHSRDPFQGQTPLSPANATTVKQNTNGNKLLFSETIQRSAVLSYANMLRCRCLLVPGSWSWLCSTPQTVVTQMYSPTKRITNKPNKSSRTNEKKNSNRML